MAWFGNNFDDDTSNTTIAGRIKGNYDAPSSDGIAKSVWAKCVFGAGSNLSKCALYEYVDYSSVYAGNLIAQTIEINQATTGGSAAWREWPFPNSQRAKLKNGTNYYIVIYAERGTVRYKSGTPRDSVYTITAYNGFPSPWTGEIQSSAWYDIYCEYDELESSGLRLGLGLGGYGGKGGRIPHLDNGLGMKRHPRSRVH